MPVSDDDRSPDCFFPLIDEESKSQEGVSSCLLTPTDSPRHSGVSEERKINGDVSSGGWV